MTNKLLFLTAMIPESAHTIVIARRLAADAQVHLLRIIVPVRADEQITNY